MMMRCVLMKVVRILFAEIAISPGPILAKQVALLFGSWPFSLDLLFSLPYPFYFFLALRIRTTIFGEQDESVAAVLQYMGTLEFRSDQLDRALQLLNEFVRIREEIGAENDQDYVNVLIMVGNIHKMKNNEEEAKRCWTTAYKVFKDIGLAEGNPQIAAVMTSLLKDSIKDDEPKKKKAAAPPDHNDDMDSNMNQQNGGGVAGVNVGSLVKGVKSLTNKVKGTTKRRKDRGQQL